MVAESITQDQSQKRSQPLKKRVTRNQRRTATFYLLISPWVVGFLLLGILPFVIGFLTPFTR